MLYSAYTDVLPMAKNRRHAEVEGNLQLIKLFDDGNNISPDDFLHLYTGLYVQCLYTVKNTSYCSQDMYRKFGHSENKDWYVRGHVSCYNFSYTPEPKNVNCKQHTYRHIPGTRGMDDTDPVEDYDNEKKIWGDIIETGFVGSIHDFSTSTIFDRVFDLTKAGSVKSRPLRSIHNVPENISPNLLGTDDDWRYLYDKVVTLTESSSSPEFKQYCYRKLYPVFEKLADRNISLWDDMSWLKDFSPLIKQPTNTADVFITRDNTNDNEHYFNSLSDMKFRLNDKYMSIRSGYGSVSNGNPVKLIEVFKSFETPPFLV